MPTTRTPRSLLVAVLAALLLVAAACGGDTEPSATVSSEGAPAPTADDPTGDDPAGADDPTEPDGPDEPDEPAEPDEPGEPIDACTLLTADDATEALGEEAVPGPVQETDECEWMTADELRTVQVARLSDDVDTWRQAHANDSFEPVDGLGEEAYYGAVFDDLSFLVDGEVYEVDVELRGEGDGQEVATELAEVVISRL